jgi:hypothetical protein
MKHFGWSVLQVVIKLQDTHPEQLMSDVIKSTADALRSSG